MSYRYTIGALVVYLFNKVLNVAKSKTPQASKSHEKLWRKAVSVIPDKSLASCIFSLIRVSARLMMNMASDSQVEAQSDVSLVNLAISIFVTLSLLTLGAGVGVGYSTFSKIGSSSSIF